MRISVERSGGFAGLREVLGPVDTASAPASVRSDIDAVVSRARSLSLQSAAPRAPLPDAFSYRVRIDDGRDTTLHGEDLGDLPITALIKLLRSTGASWR